MARGLENRAHGLSIESALGDPRLQPASGRLGLLCRPMGTLLGEHLVDVGGGEDAGGERDGRIRDLAQRLLPTLGGHQLQAYPLAACTAASGSVT